MTRHRDQIAHIQRTGIGAGRKRTSGAWDEDMEWDAHCDAVGQYHEGLEASIAEWCQCDCPASSHVAEWVGNGWTEPRGIERYCEGPCDDACTSSEPRTTCDNCGAWMYRADATLVRWPCEGLMCPACANVETEAHP